MSRLLVLPVHNDHYLDYVDVTTLLVGEVYSRGARAVRQFADYRVHFDRYNPQRLKLYRGEVASEEWVYQLDGPLLQLTDGCSLLRSHMEIRASRFRAVIQELRRRQDIDRINMLLHYARSTVGVLYWYNFGVSDM